MAKRPSRKLYLNLPVRDLAASKRFFERLGFIFHPRYTDQLAACMVVSDSAYVLLLSEGFFSTFTRKERCATRTDVECCVTLACRHRAEVRALFVAALGAGGTAAGGTAAGGTAAGGTAAGGTAAGATLDHGFMFASSFYDLDGHQWQLRWDDPHRVLA